MNHLVKFILKSPGELDLSPDYAPINWADCDFGLKRDPAVHGIFEISNAPIQFQLAYKDFVLKQYDLRGIDAVCEVVIEVLVEDTRYIQVFSGFIDFSTLEKVRRVEDHRALLPTPDDYLYVECEILPNDPAQKLRERAGIKIEANRQLSAEGVVLENYEMPIDLSLHSQAIFRGVYLFMSSMEGIGWPDGLIYDYDLRFATNNGFWVRDEVSTPNIPPQFGGIKYTIKNPGATGPFTFTHAGRLKIEYTILADFPAFVGFVMELFYIVKNGPSETMTVYETIFLDNAQGTIERNVLYEQTFNINENEYFFAGVLITGDFGNDPGEGTLTVNFTFEGDLAIANASQRPASTAQSYLVFEALQKAIDFCTDKSTLLDSFTFGRVDSTPTAYPSDGLHSITALTSGLSIRSVANPKAPQYSFKELFDNLNACFCLGWGPKRNNNVVRIEVERRDYFYQNEVIARFDWVENINVRAASELYFQKATFGFSKFETTESENSLDEFCTQHQRFNLIKNTNNSYDSVCGFVASGYAIERLRRIIFEGDPTKGDKYDEDTFIIASRRNNAGFLAQKNEDFELVEGCFSPSTRYNLNLSPARNFTRHLKWLNSGLVKARNDLSKWQFASGEGNVNLLTRNGDDFYFADNLLERQDLLVAQTDEAIFVPEFIQFVAPLDLPLWEKLLIGINKYKIIEVSNSDQNHLRGWIWDFNIQPQEGQAWSMAITLLVAKSGLRPAPPPVEPPPSNSFGLAFVANTFVTITRPGANASIEFRGMFGVDGVADLSDLLQIGEQVVIRWFNNGTLTTETMVVAPQISGVANLVIFTQPFSAIPGSTQFNGINMKIRVVSTGEILKFGPQVDLLVPNP
jgi:hypothetical protein